MSHITIQWRYDSTDCETCGSSYAEGALVQIDGETVLDLKPVAHCQGGEHWTDMDVFRAILGKLGHTAVEVEA